MTHKEVNKEDKINETVKECEMVKEEGAALADDKLDEVAGGFIPYEDLKRIFGE